MKQAKKDLSAPSMLGGVAKVVDELRLAAAAPTFATAVPARSKRSDPIEGAWTSERHEDLRTFGCSAFAIR
jgi:hypothetical protein